VIRLVEADLALIDAALDGDAALSQALGVAVADGWTVFPASLRRLRDALAADPAAARWGTRLFVLDAPPTLVGWGGFKGPPDADGVVELGYALAPAFRGRGLATAAVEAMLDEAFAAPDVRAVIAHTLAERNASGRVLEKAGFTRDGVIGAQDGGPQWRYRLERSPASRPSTTASRP
jgi:[ribosomal protein S5]-alanine N-acetyltransferase